MLKELEIIEAKIKNNMYVKFGKRIPPQTARLNPPPVYL